MDPEVLNESVEEEIVETAPVEEVVEDDDSAEEVVAE